MKKKVQKRILGRTVKANRLYAKRYPCIGESLLRNWQSALTRDAAMLCSWGPLDKGPYRKPGLRADRVAAAKSEPGRKGR